MINISTSTLLFGLVAANVLLKVPFYGTTLVKRYFPQFLCAFICRYDATNGYRFTFGLGSRCVGNSSVFIQELSADSTQFRVKSDLIRS